MDAYRLSYEGCIALAYPDPIDWSAARLDGIDRREWVVESTGRPHRVAVSCHHGDAYREYVVMTDGSFAAYADAPARGHEWVAFDVSSIYSVLAAIARHAWPGIESADAYAIALRMAAAVGRLQSAAGVAQ